MNKEFGCERALYGVGVDDVVDLANGRGDKESGNESENVVSAVGEPDEGRVEEAENSKAVLDTVNDDGLALVGELVDDHAEEEEVDQSPDPERVRRRRNIRIMGGSLLVSMSG